MEEVETAKNARPVRLRANVWLGLGLYCAASVANGFGARSAQAAADGDQTILGVRVRTTPVGREVVIDTSASPTFSVFRLLDPARILVDVSPAKIADGVGFSGHSGDGLLRYTLAQAFKSESSPIGRVEIGLEVDAPFEAVAEGNSIVVSITASGVPKTDAAPITSTEAETSKSEPTQGPASSLTRIGRLSHTLRKDHVELRASSTGPRVPSDAVRIEHVPDPDRIVVDIDGVHVEPKWQKLMLGRFGVDRARVGTTERGVRVVLDVKKGAVLPSVTVDADDANLLIRVAKGTTTAGATATEAKSADAESQSRVGNNGAASDVAALTPSQAPVAQAAPIVIPEAPGSSGSDPKQLDTKGSEPAPTTSQAKKPLPKNAVADVRFDEKDGFLRLTITFEKPVHVARDPKSAPLAPMLRISGASLPPDLVRTLDTTLVGGQVIKSVSTYQEDGDLIVVADVGEDAEHRQWTKQNRLYWDFRSKSGAIVTASQEPAAARVREYPPKATAAYESRLAPLAASTLVGRPKYTGKRISLDLKDADIQNVLRLLADVSKMNIVAAEDVKGKVTLKLRDVPWDQALDIILGAKQLDKVRIGNIMRVAPLDVLQKEEEIRVARKKSLEELEPLSVRLIPVSYAVAKDVKAQVASLLSGRGKLNIDERTNVLIVEDIAEALMKIERLIRSIDTQTPQVLIEARIVQALTNWSRSLGIQWGGDVMFDRQYGNSTGLNFPNTIGIRGGAGSDNNAGVSARPDFAVNLPAGAGFGSGGALGFVFGSVSGSTILNLRLTAAEKDGRAKIVSSPKVVTLDNKKAKILSGEKVPITVLTINGPTTRFIDATLLLEVTPHVTSAGSVLLALKATQNQVNEGRKDSFGTPGILVREAETQMLVKDGDTAVLGGIYRRNAEEIREYVPFFGDIPILGWMFKRSSTTDARDELLIFISPRIINRTEALVQGG